MVIVAVLRGDVDARIRGHDRNRPLRDGARDVAEQPVAIIAANDEPVE